VDGICGALDELRPAAESRRSLKTFVPDRPGHDRRYAIDATKIRRELGWVPARTFETGLRETVRWYLEHRGWCEHVQSGGYGRERLGLAAEPQGAPRNSQTREGSVSRGPTS
jgi:dTDP-glucose 4,6-dehydratase